MRRWKKVEFVVSAFRRKLRVKRNSLTTRMLPPEGAAMNKGAHNGRNSGCRHYRRRNRWIERRISSCRIGLHGRSDHRTRREAGPRFDQQSLGGVRAQFATPINIQMSLYSIDIFSRFEEVTGQTADYRAHGYLFCATTEAQLRYLRKNQWRQRAFGVKNAEMVSREDIVKMVPQMIADDIIGGAYCPTDGFVDPYGVMTGFSKRAKELGARIWLNTAVTGVTVENGAVIRSQD